jgi:hypothetical protein
MPKLYEYMGLVILFYANEHAPVHVHGKCQGREARAELLVIDGKVVEILYSGMAGRAPLSMREMQYFEEIVSDRADDIVSKWIDFFVLHKPVASERLTRRLK